LYHGEAVSLLPIELPRFARDVNPITLVTLRLEPFHPKLRIV
jgi:hypothetical protein